jgi:hypothetical protein
VTTALELEQETARAIAWERDRKAWNLPSRPIGEPPDELDWEGFQAANVPGRRRHDLKAIVAYAAYKRSFQQPA